MEFYVGTSGWLYGWNPEGSLDWFVRNSGLNAVELNMSFYRFPFPNMVNSWARRGRTLRWAVKVNRLITHTFKFGEKALRQWRKFHSLFNPLDECVDFYLFQLPPSMTPNFMRTLEGFIKQTELGKRFALEVRNRGWFDEACVEWASKLSITWVSVDSPDFPLNVYNTSGLVYERMHGRAAWYAHYYTMEELKEVAEKILKAKPMKAYIFFNNDHAMLENAREMRSILSSFNLTSR